MLAALSPGDRCDNFPRPVPQAAGRWTRAGGQSVEEAIAGAGNGSSRAVGGVVLIEVVGKTAAGIVGGIAGPHQPATARAYGQGRGSGVVGEVIAGQDDAIARGGVGGEGVAFEDYPRARRGICIDCGDGPGADGAQGNVAGLGGGSGPAGTVAKFHEHISGPGIDGDAIGHGDDGGAGIALGGGDAVGVGVVGDEGEVVAVVGGDVGIEEQRAPGLEGQVAAVAASVIDGDGVGNGDVVAGLENHVRAGIEQPGQLAGAQGTVSGFVDRVGKGRTKWQRPCAFRRT